MSHDDRGPWNGRALLRQVLGAVRGTLVIALAAGLAWQAVAVVVPYAVGRAIDERVLPGNRDALLAWAAVLLGLGIVRWAGDWYRHWWWTAAACARPSRCGPGC